MYSWEIKEYLESKGYKLSKEEFEFIIQTSPQITKVIDNWWEQYTVMWTDDNYCFDKIKVKKLYKPKNMK